MALVKCKECGNENAKTAKVCPKCGAALTMGLGKKVLIGIGAFFGLFVLIGILAGGKNEAQQQKLSAAIARADQADKTDKVATPKPAAQAPAAKVVEITTVLSEYKTNEVRADAAFKDQWITTTGKVGEIKKDITDSVYVTVGTGAMFEIPVIQCFVADDQVAKAGTFSKGDKVTITGEVDGLMMNVLVRECRFQ